MIMADATTAGRDRSLGLLPGTEAPFMVPMIIFLLFEVVSVQSV